MSKKALAVVSMFLLLALVGLCYAIDLLHPNWKYVTTITGTSDQTTDYFLVPNQARWRVTFNCTTDTADSYFAVSAHQKEGAPARSGGGCEQWNLLAHNIGGFDHIFGEEGPAEFCLKIVTKNVDSYTLIVEYDAGTSSLSPSPSSSPSPQETEPESFPTTWLAAIAIMAIGGAAFTLYCFTKNRKTTLKTEK